MRPNATAAATADHGISGAMARHRTRSVMLGLLLCLAAIGLTPVSHALLFKPQPVAQHSFNGRIASIHELRNYDGESHNSYLATITVDGHAQFDQVPVSARAKPQQAVTVWTKHEAALSIQMHSHGWSTYNFGVNQVALSPFPATVPDSHVVEFLIACLVLFLVLVSGVATILTARHYQAT